MQFGVVDRNGAMNAEIEELLDRRLRFALSRFQPKVQRVGVVLEDVNGPRGGIDQLCRITVKLNGVADVVITEQESDVAKCICHAVDRTGRAVSRAVQQARQINRKVGVVPQMP